jgi:hypothetical protein
MSSISTITDMWVEAEEINLNNPLNLNNPKRVEESARSAASHFVAWSCEYSISAQPPTTAEWEPYAKGLKTPAPRERLRDLLTPPKTDA